MTILTASSTFAIGAGSVVTESVPITVLPVPAGTSGRGRLVHPTLGTYDYVRGPDEWMNLDGDVLIAPIWATNKTLRGASNTLFQGDIRDVIVEERWTQPVCCELSQLRAILAMWMNPPDPSVTYVKWYPTYTSALGYNVVMLGLTLGGKEITLSSVMKQGWVKGPLVLRMRIAGRVDV